MPIFLMGKINTVQMKKNYFNIPYSCPKCIYNSQPSSSVSRQNKIYISVEFLSLPRRKFLVKLNISRYAMSSESSFKDALIIQFSFQSYNVQILFDISSFRFI